MTPFFNRAERANLLVSMLAALGLPHAYSENDDIYYRQVWCEVISFSEPEIVFALADEIAAQLPPDCCEIDAQSLTKIRAREGELEMNLALRICGFRCRETGYTSTIWTNCPPGKRGQKIYLDLNE